MDETDMNIQNMILTLQKHWSEQGCILMQAYDVEKGAGTMSPYTFLRAIGPEPWNVAYVEPSRRPADGRSVVRGVSAARGTGAPPAVQHRDEPVSGRND